MTETKRTQQNQTKENKNHLTVYIKLHVYAYISNYD